MPLKRAEIIVSGRVQKAGYRYLVDQRAYDLEITGTVENLEDGTVRIVAEGERGNVQRFLREIRVKEYPVWVRKIRKVGEAEIKRRAHRDFTIVRGDEEGHPKEIADKLDLAAYYLRTTDKNICAKIEAFQEATATSFRDLDKKYGRVSAYLAEISKTNRETSRTNRETSEHLRHLSKLVEKIAEDRARR